MLLSAQTREAEPCGSPSTGLAGQAAESVREVMAPGDARATERGCHPVHHRLSRRWIGLIALFSTLLLGQSAFAHNPAPWEKTFPRHGPIRTAKAFRIVFHGGTHAARPEGVPILGPGSEPFAPPVATCPDNPNDDETSDDPTDDDDAWEELYADQSTSEPITVWLPAVVLGLISPEAQCAHASPQPHFAPSLAALQRFRC